VSWPPRKERHEDQNSEFRIQEPEVAARLQLSTCNLQPTPVNARFKKYLLLTLAAALLVGAGGVQRALNADRDALGLTRQEALENAPPALAFTTVALGGFRGLIANALWIRANELQENDKFFEMAQLADWITKLEPHFTLVWQHQAWNMAYNISVKFKDYGDRWNWVKRGIELLRDDGLRYNPNELLMYRELAGLFQHKMGQNLDDGNKYYKRAWFEEFGKVVTSANPDFTALTQNAELRDKYKMDAAFMREVNERYGPLEWRLPEAHAIYWAALALKRGDEDKIRISRDDRLAVHRMIYQSMQAAVVQGRAITNRQGQILELAPNFEIIRKGNDAYEQAIKDDANNRDAIVTGHRNFLRDVVYYLYTDSREKESAKWFDYLCKTYPTKPLLENNPNSLPGSVTLDDYVYARLEDLVGDINHSKTMMIIVNSIRSAYLQLALGEEERSAGWERLARRVWARYTKKVEGTGERVTIPPFESIKRDVFERVVNPETSPFPPELIAILRANVNTNAPAVTNAPAAK
jgi:hypothetical protein